MRSPALSRRMEVMTFCVDWMREAELDSFMQECRRMRHIWMQKLEWLCTFEKRLRRVRGNMNPSIPCSPAKATEDVRDVSSVPGRVPMPGEPVRFPASSSSSSNTSPSHTSSSSTLSYHRPRLWGHLLLAVTAVALINPGYCQSPSSSRTETETGVCESMDIRNSPRMFEKLKGCRVVEGFLQITLIDSQSEATPAAYENISFPELREITGYLMLYRIRGLRTLGELFPNLAVIRGHTLVRDYALIIYEVMQLEEIGLYSLTDITRGSVRIEKNFILCYVNTIDWDRIAYNGKDGHYFADNKAENECPLCPGYDGGTAPGAITTNICPMATSTGKDFSTKRHLCWNQNHCQKICSGCPDGSACTANGKCCDKHCLGGCSDDSPSNCTVCRDLYVGKLGNHECVSNCPPNHYKHRDWRCITAEECRNVPLPKEYLVDEYAQKPFKPINGTCMFKCPPNYYEKIDKDRERSSCEPCNGPCIQECHGLNVDSIQAAQQLQYCTYIKGSLEINVRGGGNIVKELEKGLGMITDIQGSLKVARSYPLLSLDFLKSLKRIHGMIGNKKVETALSVTDNENLQDLWNWTTHGPIEILHGKLFFHFNPKLCYEKIQVLQNMTNETTFSELEVAKSSNGDKIACNVTLLNITVVNRTKNAVLISWRPFAYEDRRALLGYVIYSTEVANRNVTLYEGRDACGGDGWHVDDIQNTDEDLPIFHIMTQLKPYTQYAVYVKTYTIATERLGAQSDIVYIWTLPGQPSPPRITEISSLNPNSLSLRWLPPEYPNGNVTQYRITIQWEEDSESLLRQRNYCIEPLVHKPEQKKKIIEVEKTKEKDESSDSVCPCDSVNFRKDEDVIREINFEDYLQNHIYKKRVSVDQNRRRRDVEGNNDWNRGSPVEFPSDAAKDQPAPQQDFKTIEVGGFYHRYVAVLGNQTSFNISKLHHFGTQMISLWACREIEEGELKEDKKQDKTIENCSVRSIIRHRTGMLLGADDISGLNVKIQSNSSVGVVRAIWKEPEHPNSLILTYHIQYRRVDIENHALTTECITRQEFLNKSKSYTIKNLNSGNYSIRVMATSLAGNGNYSEYCYFFIEEKGSNTNMIIGIVIPVIVGVLLIGYILYKRLMPPPPNIPKTLIADVNPEYMSAVYVPDDWEVPRNDIELMKELGQGSFGMVYEGIAKNLQKANKSEIRCAVKTVNEHATERERLDFLKEASVMKAFDTPHVVRLLGVVSSGLPSLVIMELMSNGDLKSYLRLHRLEHEKPSLSRILQMAMEIADGMAYLSAKKFVHRDLAARNCMVAGDLKVKVGDFGMTRDIYETDYYRKGTKGFLPVRWMSPESLSDGVFSSSSDVWSYGVVLWEMATLASQPYQGLSNDQVLRYVIDGGVMERPENCPDKLYGLMQLTWKRPDARPTFLQLVSMLTGDATLEFREHSFFYSEEGQDLYHQVLPAVVEEASHSTSPTRMALADYLASDSYPPTTSRGATSPKSPYRDLIEHRSIGDSIGGEPHEMEALVDTIMKDMPRIGGGKKSTSPMASTAPNGFLTTWPGNNGNPNIGSSLLGADDDQQYS